MKKKEKWQSTSLFIRFGDINMMKKIQLLCSSPRYLSIAAYFFLVPVFAEEQIDLEGFSLQLQHRTDAIVKVAEDPDGKYFTSFGDTETWGFGSGILRQWSGDNNKLLWSYDTERAAALSALIGYGSSGEIVTLMAKKDLKMNIGFVDHDTQPKEKRVVVFNAADGTIRYEANVTVTGIPELSFDRKFLRIKNGESSRNAIELISGEMKTVLSEKFPPVKLLKHLKLGRGETEGGILLPYTLRKEDRPWRIVYKGNILEGYLGGKLKWRNEIDLGKDEAMLVEPVELDHEGKWFVLRGGEGQIRGSNWAGQDWVHVYRTETGESIIEMPYTSPGLVRFQASDQRGVLWMMGQNQRDEADFWQSSPFAKILIKNGSARIQHIPENTKILQRSYEKLINERYLVCASMPPISQWCWDLKTLRMIWAVDEDANLFGDATIDTSNKIKASFSVRDAVPLTVSWRDEKGIQKVQLQTWNELGTDGTNQFKTMGNDSMKVERKPSLPGSLRNIRHLGQGYGLEPKSPESIRLVAAIVGNQIQWIAYSQDGYFAASKDAGKLLGVVVGDKCHNIDQFALQLNRPDILLEQLRFSNPQIIAEFQEQYERRIRRSAFLGIGSFSQIKEIPTSEIISQKIEGNAVELKIKFDAKQTPLFSYNISVNNVPLYPYPGKKVNSSTVTVQEIVTLTEGENKIDVSCVNLKGIESARETLELIGSEPSNPADLYYIGIGVSKYSDDRINDLLYADKDATDLEGVFAGMKAGFRNIYTKTWTNGEATRGVLPQLKEILAKADENDVVVLFVAGHGVYQGDEYYFLTSDTRMEDIKNSALSFSELESVFESSTSRQRLLLLDTCESGEKDSGEALALQKEVTTNDRGLRPRVLSRNSASSDDPGTNSNVKRHRTQNRNRYVYNDLFRRAGIVVVSSCLGTESSLEHKNYENGLFTEAVLKAFQTGLADTNSDGSIGKTELINFIVPEVASLISSVSGDGGQSMETQTPTIDRDNLEYPVLLPTLGRASGGASKAQTTHNIPRSPASTAITLSRREKEQFHSWGEQSSNRSSLGAYRIAYKGREGMSLRNVPNRNYENQRMGSVFRQNAFPIESDGDTVRTNDGDEWAKLRFTGWMAISSRSKRFLTHRGDGIWEVTWWKPNDDWVAMRADKKRSSDLVAKLRTHVTVKEIERATVDGQEFIKATVVGWVTVKSPNGELFLERK